jgi:hypothetical protein
VQARAEQPRNDPTFVLLISRVTYIDVYASIVKTGDFSR